MGDSYHLEELRIALDPSHPSHELPPPVPPGSRILDIGCGAGQTLIAAYPDHVCFGIDVDLDALRLGKRLADTVGLACSRAESVPFHEKQFDFVIARVSLAYTDITRSLKEVHRVLRDDGTLWMTLHPLSLCWRQALAANWKGRLFFLYILANGLSFHFTGKVFRLGGRLESFQTSAGIARALGKAGFRDIQIKRSERFLVTAKV